MSGTLHNLLPNLSHGDHCCLLFTTPEDQIAVSVPFLAIGVERDERCVYVGDDASIERIRAGLSALGMNVEHERKKGRIVLSSGREYLDAGRFNADKMLAFLQHAYESAIADGFSALRAAGDISWEVGEHRDYREIVHYEALLDVFFLGKRMVGMCQYPKSKCPPEVLSGILNTHRVAAIDAELCSNFHYVPPQLLLEKDPVARHEKRVDWMTSQLLRAKRAEQEVLRLNAELEQRVATRTAELQAAYQDMESFSYSVSHDLRAPLRAIEGFSTALAEDHAKQLDPQGLELLERVRRATQRMGQLVEDLLRFSRVSTQALALHHVDMNALAREVAEEIGAANLAIGDLPPARGDRSLLRQVLTNLLTNAMKFTRNQPSPRIEIGAAREPDGTIAYFVKDNGVGFDPAFADRLFRPFQRLHPQKEFEGTGIGLAIIHRVVQRHGGTVRAEGKVDGGATVTFTLHPATPIA